jgi:hypothetical protein
MAQALAACETMAKKLRDAIAADAQAEFDEQGTVPTWRMPDAGITVSGSTKHPSVAIVDEQAFLNWVQEHHPSEIKTVTLVQPAWQQAFLAAVAERGEPLCDDQGDIIPGLEYRPGGGFAGISVRVEPAIKMVLGLYADEVVTGKRPLALPSEVDA